MEKEELNEAFEDTNVEGAKPISQLPPYMPLWKPTSKVTRDLDSIKFKVFTPLLHEEVPSEGELLAQVPYLKMEDWDLGDHDKFPQLEPKKYLKAVYYEELGLTRLEPMKWVAGIEH